MVQLFYTGSLHLKELRIGTIACSAPKCTKCEKIIKIKEVSILYNHKYICVECITPYMMKYKSKLEKHLEAVEIITKRFKSNSEKDNSKLKSIRMLRRQRSETIQVRRFAKKVPSI